MYLHSIPALVRWFFPSSLEWKIGTHEKELYITFDDGPIPVATPRVLDELARFNAKATFFCVGENALRHPDILENIRLAGHSIGNHTFNHLRAWKTPFNEYLDNVAKCQAVINSPLFRPPHGQITRRLAKILSTEFRIIMWSALSRDFDKNVSPENCLSTTIKATHPGSIIVFHDSEKAWERLEYVLPRFLEHFAVKGFKFRAL